MSDAGTLSDALLSKSGQNARVLLEAYASGVLSPVEVVETTLQRIDHLNGILGAFVIVDQEGAMRTARNTEARWATWRRENSSPQNTDWQHLPSWGIPISVKDTIEMAGLPTTYGSRAFADNYLPDSPIITRLRDAGCVILGKTSTSEFALSMITATRTASPARNPYDLRRTAGGSSGGAAAATAAGLGVFGLGTDSVGSIRQPAAYCGLYGLKPSFAQVKNRQVWRASPIRSHLGPLAKHVNDLIFSWRVLTGDTEPLHCFEPGELGQPPRAAILESDPDDGDVLTEGMALLRNLGVVESASNPLRIQEPPSVYSTNGDWLFAADHYGAAEALIPGFMEKHRHLLCHYTQTIYDTAPRIPAWEYRRLMALIEDYRVTSQVIFNETDLIVTSVAEAPPMLDGTDNLDGLGPKYPQLSVWNLAGNPALSLPLQPGKEGIPRAIQIVARQGEDRLLLRLALSFAHLNGAGMKEA